MIRDDRRAEVTSQRVFFFWKQWWFKGTGLGRHPVRLDASHFKTGLAQHETQPFPLVRVDRRCWWWYGDRFYYEDDGLSAEDVSALVWRTHQRKNRELQNARALLSLQGVPDLPRREGIPEDVRRFVFQRDGGRCTQCGSAELIQFDHIIPVALGGASTAENLQVLCATCNRAKSANI